MVMVTVIWRWWWLYYTAVVVTLLYGHGGGNFVVRWRWGIYCTVVVTSLHDGGGDFVMCRTAAKGAEDKPRSHQQFLLFKPWGMRSTAPNQVEGQGIFYYPIRSNPDTAMAKVSSPVWSPRMSMHMWEVSASFMPQRNTVAEGRANAWVLVMTTEHRT